MLYFTKSNFKQFFKSVDCTYIFTALINNEGISGIREAPRRMKFTFCNLLRDEKRSIMISGCQKCQSNLARTWFSHSSLPFPEDFAMDEDQKPRTLRDLEIDFLKEQLNGFSVEDDYCFGYFEGNRAEMDELLVSFQALNSTCYVLTESHLKEKNHTRFSQTGI